MHGFVNVNFTVRVFTASHAGDKIRQNLRQGNSQLLYTSGEAVYVGFEIESGTGTVTRRVLWVLSSQLCSHASLNDGDTFSELRR